MSFGDAGRIQRPVLDGDKHLSGTNKHTEYYKHYPYDFGYIIFPPRLDFQYLVNSRVVNSDGKKIEPGITPVGTFKWKTLDGNEILLDLMISDIDAGVSYATAKDIPVPLYQPIDWSRWTSYSSTNIYLDYLKQYHKLDGVISDVQTDGFHAKGETSEFLIKNHPVGDSYTCRTLSLNDNAIFTDSETTESITTANAHISNSFKMLALTGGNVCGYNADKIMTSKMNSSIGNYFSKTIKYDVVWFKVNGSDPMNDLRNCYLVKEAIAYHGGSNPMLSSSGFVSWEAEKDGVIVSFNGFPDNMDVYDETYLGGMNLFKYDFISMYDMNGNTINPTEIRLYANKDASTATIPLSEDMLFSVYSFARMIPGTIDVYDVGYPNYTKNSKGNSQAYDGQSYASTTKLVKDVDYTIDNSTFITGRINFTSSYLNQWKANATTKVRLTIRVTPKMLENSVLHVSPTPIEVSGSYDVTVKNQNGIEQDIEWDGVEGHFNFRTQPTMDDILIIEYTTVRPMCFKIEASPIIRDGDELSTWNDEILNVIKNGCKIIKLTDFETDVSYFGSLRLLDFSANKVSTYYKDGDPDIPLQTKYFSEMADSRFCFTWNNVTIDPLPEDYVNGAWPGNSYFADGTTSYFVNNPFEYGNWYHHDSHSLTEPIFFSPSDEEKSLVSGTCGHKGLLLGSYGTQRVVDIYKSTTFKIPTNRIWNMINEYKDSSLIKKVTARTVVYDKYVAKTTYNQIDEEAGEANCTGRYDQIYYDVNNPTRLVRGKYKLPQTDVLTPSGNLTLTCSIVKAQKRANTTFQHIMDIEGNVEFGLQSGRDDDESSSYRRTNCMNKGLSGTSFLGEDQSGDPIPISGKCDLCHGNIPNLFTTCFGRITSNCVYRWPINTPPKDILWANGLGNSLLWGWPTDANTGNFLTHIMTGNYINSSDGRISTLSNTCPGGDHSHDGHPLPDGCYHHGNLSGSQQMLFEYIKNFPQTYYPWESKAFLLNNDILLDPHNYRCWDNEMSGGKPVRSLQGISCQLDIGTASYNLAATSKYYGFFDSPFSTEIGLDDGTQTVDIDITGGIQYMMDHYNESSEFAIAFFTGHGAHGVNVTGHTQAVNEYAYKYVDTNGESWWQNEAYSTAPDIRLQAEAYEDRFNIILTELIVEVELPDTIEDERVQEVFIDPVNHRV